MVKLTMEPVTRIEGHAKITVQLDDDGNVVDTRLHVMEFRGFEKFLQGRPVEELARIVPRICGICDVLCVQIWLGMEEFYYRGRHRRGAEVPGKCAKIYALCDSGCGSCDLSERIL